MFYSLPKVDIPNGAEPRLRIGRATYPIDLPGDHMGRQDRHAVLGIPPQLTGTSISRAFQATSGPPPTGGCPGVPITAAMRLTGLPAEPV